MHVREMSELLSVEIHEKVLSGESFYWGVGKIGELKVWQCGAHGECSLAGVQLAALDFARRNGKTIEWSYNMRTETKAHGKAGKQPTAPLMAALASLSRDMTTPEIYEFSRCENIIQKGLDTFVEVGAALITIRDKRLYRATHATFELYCVQRWQMTARRAHQLCAASAVVNNLLMAGKVNNCSPPAADPKTYEFEEEAAQEERPATPVPTTESQARPLTRLSPENQPRAWEAAVARSNGQVPTARVVEEEVNRLEPRSKSFNTVQEDFELEVQEPEKPEPKGTKLSLGQRQEMVSKLQHLIKELRELQTLYLRADDIEMMDRLENGLKRLQESLEIYRAKPVRTEDPKPLRRPRPVMKRSRVKKQKHTAASRALMSARARARWKKMKALRKAN